MDSTAKITQFHGIMDSHPKMYYSDAPIYFFPETSFNLTKN